MAKSSKLSDNISSTTHIITELFHAENEQQSTKSDNEKDKNNNNDKKKETDKNKPLFKEDDYILEIGDRYKSITKENFLKYLEDIIDNIVDKNNYKDLSYFKMQNKIKAETVINDKKYDDSETKLDDNEKNEQEKNINLTGNFLDIDV